jgi:serine/threonine-protein kinase
VSAALKLCPQCGAEYPANARFCEIDGTALRSASGSTDLVGSIVADRYHILKKLGEGGMGQVYLAEHVKMGRKSALKVMHPAMKSDVDAVSRFNREAANASRIAHPNVASVYDFGETPDGIIYLAMEFVDGPPLTSIVEQQGALTPKRAADIVRQTAEALAVAHDMGIVHRDLKPDNIMVARTRDGRDLVKVVDFGIAKAAGNEAQKVTKTGLVVGTPEYMSPEQLAGDKLDGRSDIYSLGLVAFNLLTGTLPFPSESQQESMIMRLTDRPKQLAEMKPDRAWPAEVQAVMDRALERDVANRYQNATDFGIALYTAIDRMPETQAAEAGTSVLGAIPPTRVSAAAMANPSVASAGASVPNDGATVAAPAPAQNFGASVSRDTAPEKKSNKVGLYAGGAAAVIVIAAVIAKFALTPSAPAPSSQTSNAPVQTAASDSATVQPTGAAETPPPTEAFGKAITDGADKSSVPAGTTTASAQPVSKQLIALLDAADDAAQGATVLATVQRLEPRATSSEELRLVATLRAKVAGAKGDMAGACAELRKGASKVNAADRENLSSKAALYDGCHLDE